MSDKEIIDLLRLSRIPGLGPVRSRQLIARAGSPSAIFTAKTLWREAGIPKKWFRELARTSHLREAQSQYRKCKEQGVELISYTSPEYPQNLLHCSDAPLLLFRKGRQDPNLRPALSIVGTRKMTAEGRNFCESFIRDLLPYDPVIISGFAYGVDICAQATAMELGLQTIACMAHGLDQVYPRQHARFLSVLLKHGGMISECWLGTPPKPEMFLRRNRLIAGMSVATVVVESGQKGGSLVTADLAFGYDREVFAVPGRPRDPMSEGCNGLIRQQKAQLLRSAADLAEALNWAPIRPAERDSRLKVPDHWPEDERSLCLYLREKGEMHLDDIALGSHLSIPKALEVLFRLEMKGFIAQRPGNRYTLKV